MKLDASIILPTHSRARQLKTTLQSLTILNYPRTKYELLIVDNCSTDETKHIISTFIKENKSLLVRYIFEKRLGVHYARNTGAIAAKSELLIFIDDDVIVDKDILAAYVEVFETHSNLSASGGKILLHWQSAPPTWIIDFMGESKVFPILSRMEPYDNFRIGLNGYFFSANMAIRRDILIKFGGFHPELIGETYIGDGETGLYKEMQENNCKIGYTPKAFVYHCIDNKRMTLKYFRKRMANEGISNVFSEINGQVPNSLALTYRAIVVAIHNLKLWLAGVYRTGATDRNGLNVQLESARTFSQFKFLLRLAFSPNLKSLVNKKNWFEQ